MPGPGGGVGRPARPGGALRAAVPRLAVGRRRGRALPALPGAPADPPPARGARAARRGHRAGCPAGSGRAALDPARGLHRTDPAPGPGLRRRPGRRRGGHRLGPAPRSAVAVAGVGGLRPGAPDHLRQGPLLDRPSLLLDRPRDRARPDDADRGGCHRPRRCADPLAVEPAAGTPGQDLLQPVPDPPADPHGAREEGGPALRRAWPAHVRLRGGGRHAAVAAGRLALRHRVRDPVPAPPLLARLAGRRPPHACFFRSVYGPLYPIDATFQSTPGFVAASSTQDGAEANLPWSDQTRPFSGTAKRRST